MKLYWVTTDDHAEDWFIVAKNSRSACAYHELEEGYSTGSATAEKVLQIPSEMVIEKGWPSDSQLEMLGAVFLTHEQPRVVKINDKTYCEGLLDSIIRDDNDDHTKTN